MVRAESAMTRQPLSESRDRGSKEVPLPVLTTGSRVLLDKLFEFSEDIRSAMLVDRIGNLVSFASRAVRPVDPAFVSEIAARGTALLGGILRGSESSFGVLEWVHLRYRRLHVYCWLVDEGYLVFTSRSQLSDSLLFHIGSSQALRARYAEQWEEYAHSEPPSSEARGTRGRKSPLG